MRGGRALTLRSVFCEPAEFDDELHRVLLFYSERSGTNGESAVDRLLIVGDSLDKQRVADVASETLGVHLQPMAAADVGLAIPASGNLDFDAIAGNNADKVLAHAAGDVGDDFVPVVQFDPELRIGQRFLDAALIALGWRGKLVSWKSAAGSQNSGKSEADWSVFFSASDPSLLTCSALKH